MSLKSLLIRIESANRVNNFLIGIICLALVGVIDWVVPEQYITIFFYFFPIILTTWFSGTTYGAIIAFLSAVAFTLCNHPQFSFTQLWNSVSAFSAFLVVSMLIAEFREMLESKQDLIRIDHVTGLLNSRAFLDSVEIEIERYKRSGEPFSVAYIDLDAFKEINDLYGHKIGDQSLRRIADIFRASVRKTDIVARMGGDEFAMLLVATNHETVKAAMNKVWKRFLDEMKENHQSTTFSMGVVTFEKPPLDADSVIRLADNLMCKVKGSGKNMIEFLNVCR